MSTNPLNTFEVHADLDGRLYLGCTRIECADDPSAKLSDVELLGYMAEIAEWHDAVAHPPTHGRCWCGSPRVVQVVRDAEGRRSVLVCSAVTAHGPDRMPAAATPAEPRNADPDRLPATDTIAVNPLTIEAVQALDRAFPNGWRSGDQATDALTVGLMRGLRAMAARVFGS